MAGEVAGGKEEGGGRREDVRGLPTPLEDVGPRSSWRGVAVSGRKEGEVQLRTHAPCGGRRRQEREQLRVRGTAQRRVVGAVGEGREQCV